ncbi:bifunctional 2-polyprenyl-6-hydroxyphenol methylase/3-demethylubiquinol 3-O-methyltransferase UbiG [Methylocystis sp.]|uniref:class I SAM-dependent methyltransferase n=1 Tax=Methylocystis sp. TaxID=1911079 RepID=UPI0025DCB91D|nr:class I SAM-dependent methyltransferase [Methylocystis sp.]
MVFNVASPFDNLSPADLQRQVMDFASSENPKTWDKTILDQYVNCIIPRSIFFRNTAANAHVLDLGAGDGGLATLKSWPLVTRRDIKMYAVSLEKGAQFSLYEDFELGNFEEALPNFNAMLFDAIMCSHFIEHISDPIRALQFISTRLKPGGSVYLEWPHPMSKNMPSLTKLHDIGVNVMTTNFYDDLTHKEAWTMDHIASGLESKGLRISACGRVWFDFIADELMAHGKAANNAIDLTYAVWYKFAWAQFVVASKPL